MSEPIRRTVFFSGNVQGVGFRAKACHIARSHSVMGSVKNLLDGRVELVAEGQVDQVDAFVSAIENCMSGYLEHTTCSDSTARGQFKSFTIAY